MDTFTRAATLSDVDIIFEFTCELENTQFDKSVFKQCFATNLDKKYSHYLLAIIDDRPIGYISCHGQILLHHCGLVYEIQEMYVLQEYRRSGVGKILLEALKERINGDDHVLLEVCSNFKRTGAHRFYEASGFEKTTYKFKKVH